jgi:branched-chain amino acid aminotransferase
VVAVHAGEIATPPPSEGCLDSITVAILERLCKTLEIPFERRPIERTELLVADEVALAGTLVEIGVVRRLEQRTMPAQTPILDRITAEFWACARGHRDHEAMHLTGV